VDPRFIAAIATHETRLGCYKPCQPLRNPFGIGPGRRFSTWLESIEYASWTVTSPLYRGLVTIAQIQRLWAPNNASNDPNNLNANWVQGVSHWYRRMGGDPEAPVRN
jgi:hypothetical protein